MTVMKISARCAKIPPLLALCLAACSVGPNYVRPEAPSAPAYRANEGWKVAEPRDHVLRGAWWELFDDPQLADLEKRAAEANQSLAAAEASFRQARSMVWSARSGYYPNASVGVSFSRTRQSKNRFGGSGNDNTTSDYSMPFSVAWEPDLWGRVRRGVEASEASAQASAADVESARLSIQSELAADYFQLRALDAERRLVDESAAAYERSVQLTRNRYAGGVASRADVAQAETQLQSTRAQAIDLGVQRAQFEHAIAALIGVPASAFSIPVAPLAAGTVPPVVPVGLPSELLERRPDVAAAERRVATANAQIGVAVAAYYPSVTLSASGGFESDAISNWLTWPSRFWSVGPSVNETVFDGGFRHAQTAGARAAYDATVADYRQSVLGAFQEVEDNLSALRILEEEAQVEGAAVKAALDAMALTTNQYKAGTVSYLDVVITQTAALNNERTAVNILGRRLVASVQLIAALGGGWTSGELPSSEQLVEGRKLF